MNPASCDNQKDWITSADERHRRDLIRYAYSLCQDSAGAEDAVQETFLRLNKERPERINHCLRPWLFRVCRSRVIDAQRKQKRVVLMDHETLSPRRDMNAQDPRREAEIEDTTAHVWEAFAELTPLQAEVLRLKFQSQMSYKEIAEVTGKTVNAVGVHLHAAMINLRARLSHVMDI
jgi:RNA polymerase sigma-70 factor (ECF subfamily)|tara:strand:+ start:110627 stop:111154 length:528 start_codon:yes stop_codon:yes gene_type:complete